MKPNRSSMFDLIGAIMDLKGFAFRIEGAT